MIQKTFHKTKIATGLSLALGVSMLSSVAPLQAAEAEADIEVITVTGMLSSIKESTRLKRDASGVVDAISAEDIGKFPDTNLAESLQRITGVSIDRSNGEGSRVTVRGFGPQFNMVTLNGRAMPASALSISGGDTRAFDFQNLASGAVSSVEVYKTGKADIATGGIGASININTSKPLDNPGMHASIGGKALYDTSVRDGVRDYSDQVTPELSGLISWTDENEVFGASLNASFSERDSSATGASVNAWNRRIYDGGLLNREVTATDGFPASTVSGRPATGEAYFTPTNLAYHLEDTLRERTNAQLTLQYRPMENLTATLDYTYSELDSQAYRTELSGWYDSDLGIANFTDGLNPTPEVYIEYRNAQKPRDVATKQMHENQNTKNKSLGLNLDWDVNDNFNVKLDYHDSSSDSKPTEAYGHNLVVGIGSNIHKKFGAEYTASGLPNMIIEFDDCDPRTTVQGVANQGYNCNGQFDLADVGTTMMQSNFDTQSNDIKQLRIDGSYEFDEGSIDFGIESRELVNHTVTSDTGNQFMGGWGADFVGEFVGTGMLDPIDFNDSLDDFKISDTGDTQTLQAFRGDAKEIGKYAEGQYGINFGKNPNQSGNRTLKEEIAAIYFQVNLDGELGGMPYHVTAGVRYEHTDSTSSAFSAVPSEIVWNGNNDTQPIQGDFSTAESFGSKNSYDHLLPSFDFTIDPVKDVKARLSYSKTIARPSYAQLSAQVTGIGGPSIPTVLDDQAFGGANSGNPKLVPLESDNFDLSLEWYFDETSYVSVGYYEKRVVNFIGTEPLIDNFFGLRDVTAGPRAQQAIADLANDWGITAPNDTQLFAMVAANEAGLPFDFFGDDLDKWDAPYDIHANETDPLSQFRYNAPVNNKAAKIDGYEFAVQHFLGETGFGFQANYTIVNGDVGFDLASADAQFALEGLSDTANLVLMYEKNDFSARIAYNWRAKFLNNANLQAGEPEFTAEHEQIDISASYQVNEQLSVSFAGINITGEDLRKYGRTVNQFTFGEEADARYELGVRYTF